MGRRQQYHAPTSSLLIILGLAYIGLLLLFAWQTWEFVNWLFPGDELIFRVLTFVCFDIMSLLWALADLFFHFTDYAARTLVRWGWAVTFTLSLFASVLYLCIQGFFRYHLVITGDMLNIGYSVSIIALVFNILVLTGFLYREVTARSNALLSHQRYVRRKTRVTTPLPQSNAQVTLGNAGNVTQLPAPKLTRAQIQQRYRARQKGFMP